MANRLSTHLQLNKMLPTTPPAPPKPNPHDHQAIQNLLSRYCTALDTKTYALLDQIFVPDVEADYPFNHDMKGVTAVKEAIEKRLGPIQTHHNLTTQCITYPSPKTARAVTNFIAVHFGQGPHAGKVLQAYGRYEDELVVVAEEKKEKKKEDEEKKEKEEGKGGWEGGDDCEGVPGASGVWRVRRRLVVFVARVGEEAIMQEY